MIGPQGVKPGGLGSLDRERWFHLNAQMGGRGPGPQRLVGGLVPRAGIIHAPQTGQFPPGLVGLRAVAGSTNIGRR